MQKRVQSSFNIFAPQAAPRPLMAAPAMAPPPWGAPWGAVPTMAPGIPPPPPPPGKLLLL